MKTAQGLCRWKDSARSHTNGCPYILRLGWGIATVDESPRPTTTIEGLAGLKTPFRPAGRVTAGNSSGLNDGATAALLASEAKAKELRTFH